ncbi:hypothetical protein [Clostridium tertium]|uniref:Uncharacterized protein n=1 Tax=Clostridium tertium TaxID=1559 RepID=A0A6N3FY73_9CLOT
MKKGLVKELLIIGGVIVLVGGIVFAVTNKTGKPSGSNEIIVNSDGKNMENEKGKNQDNKKPEKSKEDIQSINFDLTNSKQTIFEGKVDVSLVNVEYDNDTLIIDGQVNNNSGESITGHVSNFYFKDSNEVITNLDFFENPRFNIDAPSGGKTNFQMIFKNLNIEGNKFTIGGEFFKLGYFGSDKKISLEVIF